MRWTEAAFWDCSWRGFTDAFAGYRRFALGFDPDDEPVGRSEARRLDRALRVWQRTGQWMEDHDG